VAFARLRLPATVVAALLPAGCDIGDSPDPPRDRASVDTAPAPRAAPDAPLCKRLRAHVTGRVGAAEATELSGLALSRSNRGVLWTHNDSGDRARVFAVAPDGRLLADVAVTGAQQVDWEDIAVGPAPDAGDALYIGDIGDNTKRRSSIVVYRAPEPRLAGGTPGATAPAKALTLHYPDRRHDAEALLVDPSSGETFIVTKNVGGTAGVYAAGTPAGDVATTMRRAGTISLGFGEEITGGDVSADGRTIVLRTYDRAFVWSRRGGESVAFTLRRRPCAARADLLVEGQAEALALTRDGRAFYTVPEGERPALRRYTPAR
jgi:hypothetical protein